jgi:hypothetical protein
MTMRELAGVILHWVSLVFGAMALLLLAYQILPLGEQRMGCFSIMPLAFALATSLPGLILAKVGDWLFAGTTRVGTVAKWLNFAVLLPVVSLFLFLLR